MLRLIGVRAVADALSVQQAKVAGLAKQQQLPQHLVPAVSGGEACVMGFHPHGIIPYTAGTIARDYSQHLPQARDTVDGTKGSGDFCVSCLRSDGRHSSVG